MPNYIEGNLVVKNKKICIIVSRFNDFVTDRLVTGAVDLLIRSGVEDSDIDIIKVPGAFEIPLIAKEVTKKNKYDAIICLGAVIRGETSHFDYVSSEVSKGIALVSLESSVPIIFGILTTESVEQAIDRSGAKSGNKGWNAALSAIEMVNLMDILNK